MARFVGIKVEFGADTDELALKLDARDLPLIHSDPYLNDLLLKYCEAALADRRGDKSPLRTRVENAISSVLPHGRVLVEDVARSLGMSERTLARKLSDERLNFTEILQQLRRDLAVRYLDDPKLHVSKIAWLLGFRDVSAFTHAYKRWTGKTPRQMRAASLIEKVPWTVAPCQKAAMASMSKSLAQTNKSQDRVKATKRYRPEGDVREAKETAHFFHHRRVKRPSLICSAN